MFPKQRAIRLPWHEMTNETRFQSCSRCHTSEPYLNDTASFTSFPQVPGDSLPSSPAAAAVGESHLPGNFLQHPSTSPQSKVSAAPAGTHAQLSPVAAAAQSLALAVLILPHETLEPGAAHVTL